MRILYNGNIGIGTTAPGNKLAISGGLGIGTTAPGSVYLSTTAPDGGLIVEGNVGIGTTNPLAYLSVAKATGSKASLNVAPSSAVNPDSPNIGDMWFNGTNLFFRKDGSTSMDLLTSVGSQWINSGSDIYFGSGAVGEVGIGTATPGAVLEINGGTREITGLKINNLDAANYVIDLSGAGVSGSGDYYIFVDNSTTYWRADGAFETPGSVTATSLIDYDSNSYFLDPSNATTSLLVAGKVGIGTLSPDNLLSLNMDNGDPILDFRMGNTTMFSLGVDDSDSRKFKIESGSTLGNENPALVINSTNQVGLGTYNPDNTLTLNEPVGTDTVLNFKTETRQNFPSGLTIATATTSKSKPERRLGESLPLLSSTLLRAMLGSAQRLRGHVFL